MANFCRLVFMVLAILLVALAAAAQQPEGASALHAVGFDGGWACEQQTCLPPDERQLKLLRHIEEKDRVTNELLSDQLTLFEAAAIFLQMDEEDTAKFCPYQYRELSHEERACREVIVFARLRLEETHSTTAENVIEQLEETIRRQQDPHQVVTLEDAVRHAGHVPTIQDLGATSDSPESQPFDLQH